MPPATPPSPPPPPPPPPSPTPPPQDPQDSFAGEDAEGGEKAAESVPPELYEEYFAELTKSMEEDDDEMHSDDGSSSSCAVVLREAAQRRARSGEVVRLSENADTTGLRRLVRSARIVYDSLRLHCSRSSERARGHRSRPDLRASTIMLDAGLYLHRDVRIVGVIPGVCIGDVFMYRAELMVLGVHGVPQGGIDFIPACHLPENEPIATSVMVSGGYLDDEDKGDGNVIMYTGSGGRPIRNDTRHYEDQKLEKGNLGLERNIHYGIEVRVVRGLTCEMSPSKRVFVYDGLYKVVECRNEVGKSGKAVYKYKLQRMEGQEELGSKKLKMAAEIKNKLDSGSKVTGYLTRDLSEGKEPVPVAVFNDVDEDAYPMKFEYLPRPELPKPAPQKGCLCQSDCMSGCSCAARNMIGFAYDENGYLLRGQQVVYECGVGCGCPITCPNRLTQRGMRFRLEVFRSQQTEWGVRPLDVIPAGSYVCEFSGVALGKDWLTLGGSARDTMLVDAGGFKPNWREWGDVSSLVPGYQAPQFPSFALPDYNLDVTHKRNVACYISNSSCPNLFVQYVIRNGEDEKFPHLAVFAMENIPPLRELSIHYEV